MGTHLDNFWRLTVGNWEEQDQFKYSEPHKFGSGLVISKRQFPWLALCSQAGGVTCTLILDCPLPVVFRLILAFWFYLSQLESIEVGVAMSSGYGSKGSKGGLTPAHLSPPFLQARPVCSHIQTNNKQAWERQNIAFEGIHLGFWGLECLGTNSDISKILFPTVKN